MAPPFGLTRVGSSPSSSMQATDWLANASLISMTSRSATPIPARASALRTAGTGPIPITSGWTPATAVATTRAMGRSPSALAASASTRSTAAAPSLMPELLPAVTEPPARNAGRSAASASGVLSGRGCSSRSTRVTEPLRPGTLTATSWPAKRPASMAAPARRWLSAANASCRSRETAHWSATRSAVSPSEIGGYVACIAGLTKRQPRVVSSIVRAPRSYAASGLSITNGARVIDSTPPAMNTSPSPAPIACAAVFTACSPEPHSRLTVWPATSTGSPARSAAMRATFRLSSPAWLAQPRITSSTRAGSTRVRSTTARMTAAARSSGRTGARAPP